MAQNIKLKRSATAGKVPTTSQLDSGELAINTNDGKVYFKRDDSTIQTILTTNSTITGSFTLNGDLVANSFSGSLLRLDQDGTGLRMTNVGAFDNDGNDNFRIFATNDLILAAGGDAGTVVTFDSSTKDASFTGDLDANDVTIDEWGSVSASLATINDQALSITNNTNNYILTATGDANTPFNGESNLVFDGSKLGVGTSSPLLLAHFKSGSSAQLLVESDTDSTTAGILFKTEDTDSLSRVKGGIFFDNSGGDIWGRGKLVFATENTAGNVNVSTSNARMTILSNGDVGIGTATPQYGKLQVYGDLAVGGDGTDAILRFIEGTDGWNIRHVANGNKLAMSNIYGGTDHFTILETGEVGIGDTTPSYKLDVNGTGRFTGRLYLDTVDANTSSVTALVLNGSEIEKRTLGSNAFTGTSYLPLSGGTLTGTLTTRHAIPSADRTYDLGTDAARYRIVFCETLDSAGVHESNLTSEGIESLKTGTVLVWKEGRNIPCTEEADHMRMGVAVNGITSPLVQGAEPVLCTGEINEGDYLITSGKEGHAKGISREEMLERNLYDCVLGKALENGSGESYLLKVWITI